MMLYPAIDLLDARCVRLSQGRFDQVTVYGDDPVAIAQGLKAAGATHLHMVDLNGSREGKASQADLIKQVVSSSHLKVQLGGGIRSVETAAAYIEAGVERVVIGSLAAKEPAKAAALVQAIGPERVTLALDVRASGEHWALALQGWTEVAKVTPWDLLARFLDLGVEHVLCTDIGRDGELSGPNLQLYRDLRRRFPAVKLLASGGVSTLADLSDLRQVGATGVIVGKALYAGRFTIGEALECCAKG